ncbi:MAG TPA: FUSC family protein [Conexibacter sp.]
MLKAAVFLPLTHGRLRRSGRAFSARCRGVVRAAVELFDAAPGHERERASRRLRRRLLRVNETALVIDGLLAEPLALPRGSAPEATHTRLFELELIVQNIGRLADALAASDLPADLRSQVRDALAAARDGTKEPAAALAPAAVLAQLDETVATRLERLGGALSQWSSALETRLQQAPEPQGGTGAVPFESAVTLASGNLPGSALVGAAAAGPAGRARDSVCGWLHLDAPAQAAIRMAIAVGAASALGSLLSDRRFYWAVIAVFIAFTGTNTSGEQILKALSRVLGTVVGILVGSLLAHAVGHSTWSVVVILAALSVGVYFIPVSYIVMVIAITISVSQLYEQLGEFSDHLLVLRVEETAIGAAVAMAAALLVFPVHTRAATTLATRNYLTALSSLLEQLGSRISNGAPAAPLVSATQPAPDAPLASAADIAPEPSLSGTADTAPQMPPTVVEKGVSQPPLTAAARTLDSASHQLLSTARPLARSPFRRDRIEHDLGLIGEASYHVCSVVADVEHRLPLDPGIRASAVRALQAQSAATNEIAGTLSVGHQATPHASPTRPAELRARLDAFCDSDGAPVDGDQRRFLSHLDRLDETISELRGWRASEPPKPGSTVSSGV